MQRAALRPRGVLPRLGVIFALFFCFCAMYYFSVPEVDVFLFAREYGGAGSLFRKACDYGNGRLLGNLLGFFFSIRFDLSYLLMAVCMTAIVLLCNRVCFGGRLAAVCLPALVLAFPSAKMVHETSGLFASFTNYVVPIVFFLLNILLLQTLSRRTLRAPVRVAAYALLFCSAAAAALFSENTTIVLLTFALLVPVCEKLRTRTVSASSVLHLLGTLCGGALMVLLPVWTHSAHKMDEYRETVFGGVTVFLRETFSSVLRTCGILYSFTFAIALLSLGLLLRLHNAPSAPAVRFARGVLAASPLLSLLVTQADLLTTYSRSLQALQVLPVLAYAAALGVAIFYAGKEDRLRDIAAVILLLSSVGPMLFVKTYGYRTYYITWILLLLWAFDLLAKQQTLLRAALRKTHCTARQLAVCGACAFVVMSAVFATQSAINFDVYALRTAQIGQALEQGEAEITVPMLPCRYVSGEDRWPYSVEMVCPDPDGIRIVLAGSYDGCRDKDTFIQFTRKISPHVFRYAFTHREYKNACILDERLSAAKLPDPGQKS